MHNDAKKRRTQQLEQVITTIFTCRSVVKYNFSLDEKQKERMLQDIDASLAVLHEYVRADTAVQPHLTGEQFSQTDHAAVVHASDETLKSDGHAYETLQALYRMYYAYLDMNRKTNLQAFASRFSEVISTLEELQRLFEQEQQALARYSSFVLLDSSPLPMVAENLLQKVKVFISDLYYIFMDFIRTLSAVLQQNDVHLNTEKLPSLPERRSERIHRIQLERLHKHTGSIQATQKAYQQLYRRRLQVEPQISEATAFLEFLKDTFESSNMKIYKMSEMLAQIDIVSRLLAELLHIVADYEEITKIS